MLLLARIQKEGWVWYSSEVVLEEIEQTPDAKRRNRVMQLNRHANRVYELSAADLKRARDLADLGFSGMDALHLACAESCGVDVFVTTDDKLVHRAGRLAERLQVTVENPLPWLLRQQESES